MWCGPSSARLPCDVTEEGPNFDTQLTTTSISPSFLYCMVQHVSEWPDYYCIIDLRSESAYMKNHAVGALCYERIQEELVENCQEMMICVYDSKPYSGKVEQFVKKLEELEIEPAQIYLLSEHFSVYTKRYKPATSACAATEGQFPGPLEYIPRTPKNSAVFCIHRGKFASCKTLIAQLKCFTILNISTKRLFVKTPGVKLQNVPFESGNEDYDQAIDALFNMVTIKKANVMIIDETGCDYGALLAGWLLVSRYGEDVERVCEHLTNKSSELDNFYTDTLREWAEHRPRESTS